MCVYIVLFFNVKILVKSAAKRRLKEENVIHVFKNSLGNNSEVGCSLLLQSNKAV